MAACSSRATAEGLKVDISTVGQSKGWAPRFTQWIPPAINCGGALTLTISGLSPGPHHIVTYHNCPYPATKTWTVGRTTYTSAVSDCHVSVDGVYATTITPTVDNRNDATCGYAFFTVRATAGMPVVIRFTPAHNRSLDNVFLNGFEIDAPGAPSALATLPVPADGDLYADVGNDDPNAGAAANGRTTLRWTPSAFAVSHDVYFGTYGGSDFIVRYVRVRVGKEVGTDKTLGGMGMGSTNHSIPDHCSISWAQDEQLSSRSASNLTLQRTLISEALHVAGHNNYPAGKSHGFAASIGGDVGSFHHNLLAHREGRNWSLAGGLDPSSHHAGRLDIRNNVVYNWDGRTTDGGAKCVNFVRNYYKPGPASQERHELNPQFENPGFGPQQYYAEGNVMEGVHGPEGPLPPFAGVDPHGTQPWPVTVPEPFFEHYVTTHSAAEAYGSVLADVGCNRPMLDEHDTRIIHETRHGTLTYRGSVTNRPGLPDNQADVGGWEDYPEMHHPADFDTDQDGLPDWWEVRYGLNPHSPAGDYSDSNGDLDDDGYTNLEGYLNYLAQGGSPIPDDAGMAQTQIDDSGGNPSSEDPLRLLLR